MGKQDDSNNFMLYSQTGELNVKRYLIGMLLGGLSIGAAQALEFEQKGDVVFVTGADIDSVDAGRFEDAIAKGAKTIVLSKIGGGRINMLAGIGHMINKAGVTTVATDWCGPSCAYLFMAGKQRRFGTIGSTPSQSPVFLSLAGARFEGGGQAARSTATYRYFKDAFGDSMPRDLLDKYTTNGAVGEYVVFTKPSKSFPEGQVLECVTKDGDNQKKAPDCKPVEGITSVRAGALTSAEPYDISGNAPSKAAPPPVAKSDTVDSPAPNAAVPVPAPTKTPDAQPGFVVTEKNVSSIIMARKMTKEEGAQGVGTVFTPEGKLALVTTFQWDADRVGGSHSIQVKWYRNNQVVKVDREVNMEWRQPPFMQWFTPSAVELGVGNLTAEVIVDGRVVGKKKFTIKEI